MTNQTSNGRIYHINLHFILYLWVLSDSVRRLHSTTLKWIRFTMMPHCTWCKSTVYLRKMKAGNYYMSRIFWYSCLYPKRKWRTKYKKTFYVHSFFLPHAWPPFFETGEIVHNKIDAQKIYNVKTFLKMLHFATSNF